jgi:L-alanine-DL-glutamate epimerase-like enolase superfamily enzyme
MRISSHRSRWSRRRFVRTCAASAVAAVTSGTFSLRAADVPSDIRITRVVAFDLRCARNKVAGKNARLDVHGDSAVDPMVRIYTSAEGVEGIGICRAKKEKLAELLGRDPVAFLDAEAHRMRSPLASQTMALWDLVARMREKPVCELLGAPAVTGPRKVPVYDGSIYFADLLPQYADAWEDRFKREIDMGLELGHRAFKIKVGRGAKWMARDAGDARDVAVVRLIRAHAGKDVLLGVDANNGYDLEGAKRFLDQVADAKLAFAEELFPEVVEQCLALKEFIRARKWDTLLADGETQGELEPFKPFVAAKAIDVLQADMNHFGVEGILDEADMARPQGIRVAPHNWGSLLGYYHQLHVGGAIDNFYRAERDPLSTAVLIADGYTIKDGIATLPPTSGFGLRINEERFAAEAKVKFDLKA